LLELLAPVSDGYLRTLLRAAGAPLAPLVEGVRQEDFEQLERTLLAIEREYSQARAATNRARMTECRRLVIEARDHTRWAVRSPKLEAEHRGQKEQMLEWMAVWLDNPGLFPTWVALRKLAEAHHPDAGQ